jgi:hypothetical protein
MLVFKKLRSVLSSRLITCLRVPRSGNWLSVMVNGATKVYHRRIVQVVLFSRVKTTNVVRHNLALNGHISNIVSEAIIFFEGFDSRNCELLDVRSQHE